MLCKAEMITVIYIKIHMHHYKKRKMKQSDVCIF